MQASLDCKEAELRKAFFEVLSTRRAKREVACTVTRVETPREPLYQTDTHDNKVMFSCPRGDSVELEQEYLHLRVEAGDQGFVPVLILKAKVAVQSPGSLAKRPAVVFLHSSSKHKEELRPLLEAYATRGYVAIGVDSRYHGERATSKICYKKALVSAWKNGDAFPFIYDTVYDLIKLMDYLCQREDIDPQRIGITGESLGGMHAWFAAAMDLRYAAAVPIIGAQSFRWAIANNKWHARVESIHEVFEVARKDLQKKAIDAEVVARVWDRLAPGLINEFDAVHTIPAISPRPLLILNVARQVWEFITEVSALVGGALVQKRQWAMRILPTPIPSNEQWSSFIFLDGLHYGISGLPGREDPRCPIKGLEDCLSKTRAAYIQAGVPSNFKFIAEDGVGHCLTVAMVQEASNWFDKVLQPRRVPL